MKINEIQQNNMKINDIQRKSMTFPAHDLSATLTAENRVLPYNLSICLCAVIYQVL